MANKLHIILIHESILESWVRDGSSVLMFVGLIGIGVFLDSTALQWVGAILGFLTIISRAKNLFDRNKMTVAEARKRLDEIEASFVG